MNRAVCGVAERILMGYVGIAIGMATIAGALLAAPLWIAGEAADRMRRR